VRRGTFNFENWAGVSLLGEKTLLDYLKAGLNVTLVVGENGAGKSRLLREIATRERWQRKVFAISNTVYDRFSNLRGVERISASSGKNLPQRILKRAIVNAMTEGPIRLRALAETLSYCTYEPRIGLKVTFKTAKKAMDDGVSERTTSPDEIVSVIAADPTLSLEDNLSIDDLRYLLPLLMNRDNLGRDGLWWLDFDDSYSSSRSNQAAQILVWEPHLRAAGYLSRVELFLSKKEWGAVPLHEASSGQLTLIACLAFLNASVTDESIVLIDEPENSLHPRWQREYVERLLAVLSYRQPNIVIATHAPIIVSGAQLLDDVRPEVLRLTNDGLNDVTPNLRPGEKASLEETLFESFRTVTPANRFVSESLSREFSKLRAGTTTAVDVAELVDLLRDGSFDPQQISFLDRIVQLARTVEAERINFGVDGA